MNMFKMAIACSIAFPAVVHAQTPASPLTAGHENHGAMADCCEGDAEGRIACCERMRAMGHDMPCCEEAMDGADPHAGHDMNGQGDPPVDHSGHQPND